MNVFKIKKWGAGFLMAFIPAIALMVMLLIGDLMYALAAFGIVAPFVIFIGFRILKHPIIDFLEGKGLLVFTLDSTGVIDTFIVKVNNPYLVGDFRGKPIETIFNRSSVMNMSYPKKIEGTLGPSKKDSNIEELVLKIPKDKKHDMKFGFLHFPVLIYNKNLETFITKETLADFEKDTFVKHMVLYLNRKVEDLTSSLRDFARYIVEQTRPKGSWFNSGILKWIVIIAVIGFLALMAAPMIIGFFEGQAAPVIPTDLIIGN